MFCIFLLERMFSKLSTVTSTVRFQQDLMNWYQINHRSLPWRETKNPYYIWISEIML